MGMVECTHPEIRVYQTEELAYRATYNSIEKTVKVDYDGKVEVVQVIDQLVYCEVCGDQIMDYMEVG